MPARFSSERGSIVLVSLCFTIVVGIALASYITLCYTSLTTSTGVKNGAQAVELAQMGLEEAMWSLNQTPGPSWTGGWVTKGTDKVLITSIPASVLGQGRTGTIQVRVENFASTTSHVLWVEGRVSTPNAAPAVRQIKATIKPAPAFPNVLAGFSSISTHAVRFRAGGSVDSYDSLSTPITQAVDYNAAAAGYSAALAATNVTLTDANIKGYVFTFGNAPVYSVGTATIKGPQTPAATKIDTSRMGSIANLPKFAFNIPSTAGAPVFPGSGTVGASGVAAVYKSGGVVLSGGTTMTIKGQIQLVITGGDFDLGKSGGGTPKITIFKGAAADGHLDGSLEVFCDGDIYVDGNGIDNLTKDPRKVALYRTNLGSYSSTSEMNTGTAFYGVVYVPDGRFNVQTSQTILGAIAADTVYTAFGTTPVFHYDVALRHAVHKGLYQPYAVTQWQELAQAYDSSQAIAVQPNARRPAAWFDYSLPDPP